MEGYAETPMNQGWAQDLIKNELYTTTKIRILMPHMYYMDPPKLGVKGGLIIEFEMEYVFAPPEG